MNELVTQDNIAVALLATYVIQWLKEHPSKMLSWLSEAQPGIVRGFSALVAALSAAGITYEFDAGTLTVAGLTAVNVGNFLVTAVFQFVFQHFAFRVGISVPRRLQNGKS